METVVKPAPAPSAPERPERYGARIACERVIVGTRIVVLSTDALSVFQRRPHG